MIIRVALSAISFALLLTSTTATTTGKLYLEMGKNRYCWASVLPGSTQCNGSVRFCSVGVLMPAQKIWALFGFGSIRVQRCDGFDFSLVTAETFNTKLLHGKDVNKRPKRSA